MPLRDRLVTKYQRLLDLHLSYRNATLCHRLPPVSTALDVVRSRIAALDAWRIAA